MMVKVTTASCLKLFEVWQPVTNLTLVAAVGDATTDYSLRNSGRHFLVDSLLEDTEDRHSASDQRHEYQGYKYHCPQRRWSTVSPAAAIAGHGLVRRAAVLQIDCPTAGGGSVVVALHGTAELAEAQAAVVVVVGADRAVNGGVLAGSVVVAVVVAGIVVVVVVAVVFARANDLLG